MISVQELYEVNRHLVEQTIKSYYKNILVLGAWLWII